jgi:hypothetical protein
LAFSHHETLAVTSWRSVIHVVKVSSDKGFAVFCFGRVLVGLKIFEGKEILKNNFPEWQWWKLFCKLWS